MCKEVFEKANARIDEDVTLGHVEWDKQMHEIEKRYKSCVVEEIQKTKDTYCFK